MNNIKKPSGKSRGKSLNEYKLSLIDLSSKEFNISIGVLLGDASLQTQDNGKSYRLKFLQGDINKEYIFHLYRVLKRWVLSPPKRFERFHKSTQNIYVYWAFQTIAHPAFNKLAQLFINKDNKKSIQKGLILNYLTPEGLAYWFMDDGGKLYYNKDYNRRGFALNTQGFQQEEVELLIKELTMKFSLFCRINPNRNYYIIAIPSNQHEKFLQYISPYIISSMVYKIKTI